MSTELIDKHFGKMGARVKVVERPRPRIRSRIPVRSTISQAPSIDIGHDNKGEHFLLRVDSPDQLANLQVLQVDPTDRHLLLMLRDGRDKSKFLCGHDERHWFVAAIPELASATTIRQAKESLQPDPVRRRSQKVRSKNRLKRKNEAFRRQGEWFFVPVDFQPEGNVHKNEPITRGRGKPHVVEYLIRDGGQAIMDLGGGKTMSMAAWGRLSNEQRRKMTFAVQRQLVGRVFAKGAISHPDHATIHLDKWHEVVMNTEQQSRAMRNVAFMD